MVHWWVLGHKRKEVEGTSVGAGSPWQPAKPLLQQNTTGKKGVQKTKGPRS
jgi:hypothetical protein